MTLPNWFGKRVRDRPAILIETHLDSLAIDSCFQRPITKIHCASLECDKARFTTVFYLFRIGDPVYITRLIISIIINAVKRMIRRWSDTNISKKILKGIKPLTTNCDSTTTIMRIPFYTRIFASGNHASPCPPLFRSFPIHRMTVNIGMMFISFWSMFLLKTSTTLRLSHFERIGFYRSNNTTITSTKHPRSTMAISFRSFSSINNKPSSKSLTNHIQSFIWRVKHIAYYNTSLGGVL